MLLLLVGTIEIRALFVDLVHEAEFHGRFCAHEIVALQRGFNRREILAGVLHVDLVQAALDALDLFGVNQDIRCLALEAARGLMEIGRASCRERVLMPV